MTASADKKTAPKSAKRPAKKKGIIHGTAAIHKLAWKIGRKIVSLLVRIRYGYTPQPCNLPQGPYLVYANHTLHWDPLLLSVNFPQQMYYVASDHLRRARIAPLMLFLADPILHKKSRMGQETVMEMLRRLRAGHNVLIFIEGERCYCGTTERIDDSAAHLAKMAGCPLITYRVENGYFTESRWATNTRRGNNLQAQVVNIYTTEQLKKMSREEVIAAVRADLHFDSYAAQAQNPTAYKGKRLAEGLETTLYMCPLCGQIGSLHSCYDRFYCDCGMQLSYTPYGYLEAEQGSEAPFTRIDEWYAWQQQALADYIAERSSDDSALFIDDEQTLLICPDDKVRPRRVGKGRFSMYRDRLEFCYGFGLGKQGSKKLVFPLKDVQKISCHEQQLLSFSCRGTLYELTSSHHRSAVKYQHLFRLLQTSKDTTIPRRTEQTKNNPSE